jgi:hypothetical protein
VSHIHQSPILIDTDPITHLVLSRQVHSSVRSSFGFRPDTML